MHLSSKAKNFILYSDSYWVYFNELVLRPFQESIFNFFLSLSFQGLFQAKTESDFQTLLLMTYFFQKFVLSK